MSTTMNMKSLSMILLVGGLVIATAEPVRAQSDDELAAAARAAEARLQAEQETNERAAREAEARAADMQRQAEQRAKDAEARAADRERLAEQRARDVEARAADREREMEARVAERQVSAEARMRLAEEKLAEAARQVAELSMQQLPRVERIERVIRRSGRPVLGIMIDDEDMSASDEPVAGVLVVGISPGGAAAEAGLRADDVITSINGESMAAESAAAASGKLFEFMEGVESGDVLAVEFLRNGKTMSAEVKPESTRHAFAFRFGDNDFVVPDAPLAPDAPRASVFRDFNFFLSDGSGGFGDMELVKLTDRLGSYFGTSKGLLIVRAPTREEIGLQDGDVILNIDGREPTSVSHAMRILGSYEPGESVKLEIMRDRRRRTVEVEMPDRRRSMIDPRLEPALAPLHEHGASPELDPVEQRFLVIEAE